VWRERTAWVMWERIAAPMTGEGAEGVDEPPMSFAPVPVLPIPKRLFLSAARTKLGPEVDETEATASLEPLTPRVTPPMPLVALLTSGTTAMEAVRVTSVVSGVWGVRVMAP